MTSPKYHYSIRHVIGGCPIHTISKIFKLLNQTYDDSTWMQCMAKDDILCYECPITEKYQRYPYSN